MTPFWKLTTLEILPANTALDEWTVSLTNILIYIKCNSGVSCVIVSDTIKHVTIGKHREDLIAWVVLDSTALGSENDIHIANVYVPPDDSVHLPINAFDTIQNIIAWKFWNNHLRRY